MTQLNHLVLLKLSEILPPALVLQYISHSR